MGRFVYRNNHLDICFGSCFIIAGICTVSSSFFFLLYKGTSQFATAHAPGVYVRVCMHAHVCMRSKMRTASPKLNICCFIVVDHCIHVDTEIRGKAIIPTHRLVQTVCFRMLSIHNAVTIVMCIFLGDKHTAAFLQAIPS